MNDLPFATFLNSPVPRPQARRPVDMAQFLAKTSATRPNSKLDRFPPAPLSDADAVAKFKPTSLAAQLQIKSVTIPSRHMVAGEPVAPNMGSWAGLQGSRDLSPQRPTRLQPSKRKLRLHAAVSASGVPKPAAGPQPYGNAAQEWRQPRAAAGPSLGPVLFEDEDSSLGRWGATQSLSAQGRAVSPASRQRAFRPQSSGSPGDKGGEVEERVTRPLVYPPPMVIPGGFRGPAEQLLSLSPVVARPGAAVGEGRGEATLQAPEGPASPIGSSDDVRMSLKIDRARKALSFVNEDSSGLVFSGAIDSEVVPAGSCVSAEIFAKYQGRPLSSHMKASSQPGSPLRSRGSQASIDPSQAFFRPQSRPVSPTALGVDTLSPASSKLNGAAWSGAFQAGPFVVPGGSTTVSLFMGVPGDELVGGPPAEILARTGRRPMSHWTSHVDGRPTLRSNLNPQTSNYLTLARKSYMC